MPIHPIPLSVFQILFIALMTLALIPLNTILWMLFYNQCSSLYRNQTTIEMKEHEDDDILKIPYHNPYDLGWMENMRQALGSIWFWWLPWSVKGDGYLFELKK